jgi:hypothetical protein
VRNGETLGNRPTLRPGATITAEVTGFAPRATVEVSLVVPGSATTVPGGTITPAAAPTVADAQGRVRLSYRVPAGLAPGSYRLAISGPGRPTTPAAGTIRVTVPRVAFYAFSVR